MRRKLEQNLRLFKWYADICAKIANTEKNIKSIYVELKSQVIEHVTFILYLNSKDIQQI